MSEDDDIDAVEARLSCAYIDHVAQDPPDPAVTVTLTITPDLRRDLHDLGTIFEASWDEMVPQLVQASVFRLLRQFADRLPSGRPDPIPARA